MKKRHLAIAVSLLAAGAYWWAGDNQPRDARHLYDRPWVSAMPEDPREPFHAMFVSKQHKAGVAMVGSKYQHLISALGAELDGDKLKLNFLQQELKVSAKVTTWQCKDAPKGLDLCLELDFRLKKLRLYSSSKWSRAEDAGLTLAEGIDGRCDRCVDGEPEWITSQRPQAR